MKKTQNVYRAVEFMTLDTYIKVDGKPVLVEFRGGILKPRSNGIYVTNDPKMIAAMNSDSGLNKSFVLVSTTQVEDGLPEPQTSKPEATGASTGPDLGITGTEGAATGDIGTDGPTAGSTNEFTSVPEINTVGKAREYLVEHVKDLKVSTLPNKEAVIAVAAENKIIFVDLK